MYVPSTKLCTGYLSCSTRTVNNSKELVGDYLYNEQLQTPLPKFNEIVSKICVINRDYCLLLPKES